MSENNLIALAERCEAATGPDRALDADIVRALYQDAIIYPYCTDDEEPVVFHAEPLVQNKRELPRYTASIDAAMTLVPDGWDGGLYLRTDTHKREVQLETPAMRLVFSLDDERAEGAAETLPLALCAAALRARAALGDAS